MNALLLSYNCLLRAQLLLLFSFYEEYHSKVRKWWECIPKSTVISLIN